MCLSRRSALGLISSGAALALAGCRSPGVLQGEIISSSMNESANAIAVGAISSEDVVRKHPARIQSVNPKLNAVVQLAADRAIVEAKAADAALANGRTLGPLHGVPMTIKDSLETAGVVSTAGTSGRRGFVPDQDATVVARLREAGAILMGKTNTPELTFSGQTDNLVYGRTNNPYDLDRTPGGSSGGAAAIIAAQGSPFDIGSDTGGSIRIPSSFCGIAGIKPTSGRVPRTGHIIGFEDAFESLTTLRPMARRVEDLATLLPIISGPDGRDPAVVPVPLGEPNGVRLAGLRLAFYTDNRTLAADPETRSVVENAAHILSRDGMQAEEERPAPIVDTLALVISLLDADGGAGIKRRLDALGTTEPHPWMEAFIDPEKAVSAAEAYKRYEAWAT